MRLDCSGMEFEKLADLLEQGQFELLNLPVGDERKKPSDIRLVYMMNDTAEMKRDTRHTRSCAPMTPI